jgi:hypothetical protein
LAIHEARQRSASLPSPGSAAAAYATREQRDPQRTFQLILATVWLLDAVLQIQPFMFTRGVDGFSGMLNGMARGNPRWVAHTITWNGSIVYHEPILTNSGFALIQFAIGFGIVWEKSRKSALALSIVWAVFVWWFGEGAGGIFQGLATPLGGGPGGVLFYAVLAVLLWPSEGPNTPFLAARTVGASVARGIWIGVWGLLALLSLVGSGRSPQALHDLVGDLNQSEPGWLAQIDRTSESVLLAHGTPVAIILAVVCLVVAAGVLLPAPFARITLVVAIGVFALIWVAVQNFGGILAGGATDPNSGVLVIVLAFIYWPTSVAQSRSIDARPDVDLVSVGA